MTLLELVTHLRVSILDDTGGTSVEWADLTDDEVEGYQLRWSNEELTRFIDEAYSKAVRGSFLIKKSEDAFNIDVVAGTSIYNIDPLILDIKSLTSDTSGRQLQQLEYEDLECIPKWRDKTGTPTSYVIDESDNTLRLYPKPVDIDILHPIYYRLPLKKLEWCRNTDSLEIRDEYQLDMLDYAAHLAYNKDDANTFDPTRSDKFLVKFIRNFGHTSAYGEVRRRRSRLRTVRYGGL